MIAQAPASAPPAPVTALVTVTPNRDAVAPVDPRTLRLRRRPARLHGNATFADRSPDGRDLAVMTLRDDRDGTTRATYLELAPSAGQSRVRAVNLRTTQELDGLAWLRPDRILAFGEVRNRANERFARVLVVDPRRRRVVRRVRLPGQPVAGTQVGERQAIVLDEGGAGPRLVVLDADARVERTVSLAPLDDGDPDLSVNADLDVDPVTGEVLVLGSRRSRIVRVDPVTGATVVRSLSTHADPGAELRWVGPLTVLVDDEGDISLLFLDPLAAVRRTLRLGETREVTSAGDLTLVVGDQGILRAYDGQGRQRWRARAGHVAYAARIGDLVYATRAYAPLGGAYVLSAATGRKIASRRRLGLLYLAVDNDGGRTGVLFPVFTEEESD